MAKRKEKIIDQKLLWQDIGDYDFSDDISSFAKRSWRRMNKENVQILLEIGCGLGYDSVFFAKKNLHVISVDFSKLAINHLKEEKKAHSNLENLLSCRVKDITKPWSKKSYGHQSFDAVFANKSIHYFDHNTTVKLLQNIHNVLRPDGLLFACVHSALNEYFDKGKMLEKDALYIYKDKRRRFFERPCLRKYLNGGFEILSLDYSKKNKKEDDHFLEVIARKK